MKVEIYFGPLRKKRIDESVKIVEAVYHSLGLGDNGSTLNIEGKGDSDVEINSGYFSCRRARKAFNRIPGFSAKTIDRKVKTVYPFP